MQAHGTRGTSQPASPSPAAATAGSALPEMDETSLVKLPVVRELIIENERLLCESVAFRRLRRALAMDGPTRLLLEEEVRRVRVALAEGEARNALAARWQAQLVVHVTATEEALAQAEESNERLQGYVALAKAHLSPRGDGNDDGDADDDGVRRRLSELLSEKENLSPPQVVGTKRGATDQQSPTTYKRVRLSEGSAGRRTQPSPSEITKDRKTLHETDLAVSPSRRKAVRPRR